MTFNEAIALQPLWVQYWLNVLLAGAFILPISLLVWRQSRIAAIVTLLCSGFGAFLIMWLYARMGYVRLLGLPHIVLWTPLAIYLIGQARREDMPRIPRIILCVVIATIAVSLLFDYTDALRYLFGDRTPQALPPA